MIGCFERVQGSRKRGEVCRKGETNKIEHEVVVVLVEQSGRLLKQEG